MIKHPSLLTGSKWLIFSLTLVALISGCSTLSYYQQAISGQYKLLSNRVDIDALMADSETPDKLKQKLSTVLQIREFARSELKMDVGKSYSQYSDTKQPYVVWNVTASPELSLTPHQWCYPIVGCQNYRGYFQSFAAEEAASQLQLQGLDTWVGGVSAYSTLGWFDDPVLNTFVFRSDVDLAALLIHELSHQVLYIKGDTAFNESFATAVEIEGIRRWLASINQTQLISSHQQKMKEKDLFIATVSDTIARLRALYESNISDEIKREQKEQFLLKMKDEYQKAVLANNLSGYYSFWFNDINNAKLITVANYYQYVPSFSAMIAEAEGDMQLFYQAAKELGEKDKASRDKILQAYMLKPPQ